jgi:tRNA nucleotidyltransferase (CCA-adding enzyme)
VLAYALAGNRGTRRFIEFYLDSLQAVRPYLGGSDLKRMGLKPGPLYKKILTVLRAAVLDGTAKTPEEERRFVQSYLQEHGED